MRQIFPAGSDRPELGQGRSAVAALAGLYGYPVGAGRPWVRANMIASADGAAWLAGRSGSLSGAADRLVFSVLRSLADVILVGAGTARTEGYRPVRRSEAWPELRVGRPPTPPIAVVTRRLELAPDGPLLAGAEPHARTIVLTTQAAPHARRAAAAAAGADVAVVGQDQVTVAAAVAALAERRHRRILAEGGPRILGQLAGAGMLDEMCLTVSPMLAGGPAGRILDGPDQAAGRLGLAHVLEDDGYLLCRYLRHSPS